MSRIAGLFTALVILGGSASAPAAADAPDPPGTLTFGGLQRNYVLHVPPGPPATGTGLGLDGPGCGMFVLMALGGLMIVAGGATLAAARRR